MKNGFYRIKTWEEMEEEFGLDRNGSIKTERLFLRIMENEMPADRIIFVRNGEWSRWDITPDMNAEGPLEKAPELYATGGMVSTDGRNLDTYENDELEIRTKKEPLYKDMTLRDYFAIKSIPTILQNINMFKEDEKLEDIEIYGLFDDIRIVHILKYAGIKTKKDLCLVNPIELSRLRGVGIKAYNKIMEIKEKIDMNYEEVQKEERLCNKVSHMAYIIADAMIKEREK